MSGHRFFICLSWRPEPGSLLTPLASVRCRHGAGQDPILEVLGQVVGISIDSAIYIRPAVYHRGLREVTMRRRGRCSPFQRIAVPGISPRYLTSKQTVEEIENENQLHQPENQRAHADKHVERL